MYTIIAYKENNAEWDRCNDYVGTDSDLIIQFTDDVAELLKKLIKIKINNLDKSREDNDYEITVLYNGREIEQFHKDDEIQTQWRIVESLLNRAQEFAGDQYQRLVKDRLERERAKKLADEEERKRRARERDEQMFEELRLRLNK